MNDDSTPKKRKKGTSPTARSLAECRKRRWTAGVVEKFVRFPKPGHLVDLFGVIDIIAITPEGIVGIQATSGTNHANRRDKILAEPRARQWIDAGCKLELWTWSMKGSRGKRKLWALRVETYAEMAASQDAA